MKTKHFKTIDNTTNELQLFCFPYAGGNGSIYYPWREKIDKNIELISVQLAGRATLYAEEPITNLDVLVEKLYREIEPYLDRPFAFFGHSMGGLIAYALMAHIERVSDKRAEFIIISATKLPSYYATMEDYLLSDKDLTERLKKNGATPKEVLDSKELMDIILPIYRADCKLLATNNIAKEKIKTKAFIFNSEEDVEKEVMMEWQEYFTQKIEYLNFDGGHFFIHKQEREVIEKINDISQKRLAVY